MCGRSPGVVDRIHVMQTRSLSKYAGVCNVDILGITAAGTL